MVLLALFVLFIGLPIAEIYLIVQVGEAIGAIATIALLIADSIAGSLLVRAQGRAAWRRLREAIATGRAPTREVVDGALVVLGGALLVSPGFITDVLGATLLFPPTRALVRALLMRHFRSRFVLRAAGGGRRPPRAHEDVDGTAVDVDGTAVDVDSPRLRP